MRGNLVAFADMAAFAKHTSLSLRSILSVNPSGDGNRWNSAIRGCLIMNVNIREPI